MLELRRDAARGRGLFLIVLGFLLFQYFFLIADQRFPLGHETLTRYGLQYTFMNGAAQDGTIPLWLPYATQGTTSSWAWFEQGTFLQNASLLAAPLFRGASFLRLFHLGMLLEELLLLLGVWLLASKLFRSPYTVFFVSVAVLGSSLWVDHAAQNVITVSALPLALYTVHELLETRSRHRFVLLGILLVVQALGKPPAFALIIPGAAILYGAALVLYSRGSRAPRTIAWTRGDCLCAAVPIILLALGIGLAAFAGTGDLSLSRPEGRFSAMSLLAGAGLENPLQYLDVAFCFSPNLDATCFVGTLTLAFALLGLARMGRRSALQLLALVFGGLLALSAVMLVLAALLPIPFPGRAPTPGIPLFRLFLAFLAGFGFQRLLEDRLDGMRAAGMTAAAMIFLAAFQALICAGSINHWPLMDESTLLLTYRSPPEVLLPLLQGTQVFLEQTGMAALLSGVAGGVLLLASSGSRYLPFALGLALLIHPLEVFGWRFRMDWLKTSRLTPAGEDVQKLSGSAFSRRRGSERETLERFRALQAKPLLLAGLYTSAYGTDSWLNESFWFADLPASRAPALYWSGSVESLRAALPATPKAADDSLPAPWNSAAARKLAGVSRDKLRFFSTSHAASPATIGAALLRPEFTGDLLFVEGPSDEPLPPLDRDEHLDLEYEVTGFSPNSLTVAVDAGPGGAWMSFADAWHPSWAAAVNGRSVPVWRADLAYKAVHLAEGRNVVEFRFRSTLRTGISVALGMLSAVGIAWLLRELGLLALDRRT